jgi:hypothetical protein
MSINDRDKQIKRTVQVSRESENEKLADLIRKQLEKRFQR